jgi:ketosteroid isomerase-like protein
MPTILIAIALIWAAAALPSTRDQNLKSMVEVERSFAKLCVNEGVRASFLEYFTDDGIAFTPSAVNAKQFYSSRPPGKGQFILDWQPEFSDIAAAGDLGYNTGPFVLKDRQTGAPSRYGQFFSVWRKEADGKWKVVLDIGGLVPGPRGQVERWRAALPSEYKVRDGSSADGASLKQLDAEFEADSKNGGITLAYQQFLDEGARLHRQNEFPVIGKEAILKLATLSEAKSISLNTANAAISASRDLGYSYGEYEMLPSKSKGVFAHVWKRDKAGRWKIVVEIMNPLPQ